jgi:lysine 6-dehydrogenase
MRMLVLGAGLQGSACAYDLLQNPEVERVTLADARLREPARFLERYTKDARLNRTQLDARDADAVSAVMSSVDACMNALPYYFNESISRLAIDAGIHCCDLGGNTEIVFRQLELDGAARERGVSIIPDCGLAPGMVNILAEAAMSQLHAVESLKTFVGGLPQHPKPPLNYQIVYSLEGVLDYYTTPSWVLRDGEPVEVEALSDVELLEFGEPVGTLEAFHTAGGLSTMAWNYRGKVRSMEYKTLRYPGHASVMRAIRQLGLLSQEPVRVDGSAVVPRQMFIACAEPRLRRPSDRDLVALRVVAEGTVDGARKRVVYEVIDLYDEATGVGAMERTTGFSLSVTGQFQARGITNGSGVATAARSVPAQPYVDALAERGIRIRNRIEAVS